MIPGVDMMVPISFLLADCISCTHASVGHFALSAVISNKMIGSVLFISGTLVWSF